MRINKTLYQLIYRLVWALVGITATVFTFTDHIKAWGGDGHPVALYFTTWSVWLSTVVAIIVFAFTLVRYIKGEREGYNKVIPLLKFCSNIMIIATFIVGGFVLKLFFDCPGSVFKHFLLPIVTVIDTVLFDPKKSYRISYPFLGVVLPLIYWIIVITRGVIYANGVTMPQNPDQYLAYFPYGFTILLPKDMCIPSAANIAAGVTPGGKSLGGLIGLLAGIMVGLIAVGFIFWVIDKLTIENKKIKFENKVNEETTTDIIHYIKEKK